MSRIRRPALWIFVALAVALSMFPFYWMLRTSIAPADEIFFDGLSILPQNPSLEAYGRAWTGGSVGHAMGVGLIVCVLILALQLATCIPAAFVLAKAKRAWTGKVFAFVLVCLLVPSQVTMVPLFIGLNQAGLADTLASLVLPFSTSVLGIFMIRQQMMAIPTALMEAAEMDGLGPVRTLFSVAIPMAKPGIAAFSVYSIFVHWNDYMWPLLIARSPELATPPLALAIFQDAATGFDYSALAAGAAIVTLPIVLLFLIAQKQFVQGMSGTEVTG